MKSSLGLGQIELETPDMSITWRTRGRGWEGSFPDRFEGECYVRKDSIDAESEPFAILSSDKNQLRVTQQQAGELALVLLKFHLTGEMP